METRILIIAMTISSSISVKLLFRIKSSYTSSHVVIGKIFEFLTLTAFFIRILQFLGEIKKADRKQPTFSQVKIKFIPRQRPLLEVRCLDLDECGLHQEVSSQVSHLF